MSQTLTSEMRGQGPRGSYELEGRAHASLGTVEDQGLRLLGYPCALRHLGDRVWVHLLVGKMGQPSACSRGIGTLMPTGLWLRGQPDP